MKTRISSFNAFVQHVRDNNAYGRGRPWKILPLVQLLRENFSLKNLTDDMRLELAYALESHGLTYEDRLLYKGVYSTRIRVTEFAMACA